MWTNELRIDVRIGEHCYQISGALHWVEAGTKLGTIGKQKQICNLECIKQLRLILWFWIW